MESNYALKKWAALESPPQLQERKVWTGIYRGVAFEIQNFSLGFKEMQAWTHYLLIPLDDQLSPENADKLWLPPRYNKLPVSKREYLVYDYEGTGIEFHGGCTFYEKTSGVDDKRRHIKIGCDYQHLWDEGQQYSVESVYREVKESIDSFIELYGPVKVRSTGDGKWRFIEDFE